MAIEEVHLGNSGPRVATLHRDLLYLIRHQDGMDEETRSVLESQLAHDRVAKSFGTATAGVVGLFQYQIKNRENLPKEVKTRFRNIPLLAARCRHWQRGRQ